MLLKIVIMWLIPVALLAETEPSDHLLDIEIKLLTQLDVNLSHLESELVQQLHAKKEIPYTYYLLSQVYLRLYATSLLNGWEQSIGTSQVAANYLKNATTIAGQTSHYSPSFGNLAQFAIHNVLGDQEAAQAYKKLVEQDKQTWRHLIHLQTFVAQPQGGIDDEAMGQLLVNDPTTPRGIISHVLMRKFQASWQDYMMSNQESQESNLASSFTNEFIKQVETTAQILKTPNFDWFLASIYTVSGYDDLAIHKFSNALSEKEFGKRGEQELQAYLTYAFLIGQKPAQATTAINLLGRLLKAKPKAAEQILMTRALLLRGIQQTDLANEDFLSAFQASSQKHLTLLKIFEILANENDQQNLQSLINALEWELTGESQLHADIADIGRTFLSSTLIDLNYYANAIALDPTKASYFLGLGLSFHSRRLYSQSFESFNKAVQLEGENENAIYNRGCALALLGKYDESVEDLKRAFLLNPELKQHAKTDPDLISVNERLNN
jgi:tetratricopeptide (TPR) repeat protein